MSGPSAELATQVVRWQAAHGRNHLPWQNTRDAYRVWLSEIMLQQTQVATVLEYYTRFLARFPDVRQLAAAAQDEVLALWSGLGYYSRARNLHRCAQIVVHQHGGEFPRTVDELAALPGIGRSTAGAIAAFCFGARAPILDANVRRVLTRVLGFGADLAEAKNERALWQQAEALLPRQDLSHAMPRYTQGLMDLGAGICLPRNPNCLLCPLQEACVARRDGNPQDYPVRTRKLKRSAQAWWLLLRQDGAGRLWLERRPPAGIWAGLYCPPVYDSRAALDEALQLHASCDARDLPAFTHVLTHRDLHLHPVLARDATPQPNAHCAEQQSGWFAPAQWPALGLPAPVRKLLASLGDDCQK
ncbi:A/G-specific adenine glycosylase [Diaphorobacter sp. C33]|uniref:Adenine DNA glycosylase n=1 Tax=Diaphorobacter nitroreducens TaxID=164759 RepID=A0AAX1WZ71_9BURK|nr:A/G-specific adenine glycosylase [Diaphorobacter sp. C33]ROR50814.1 A/G-specific DNA-adenine glycosylase [Diaphorobacter nitroreducens]WKK89736.1 A/G-specific adenine glycosylase [Diaphorobacter sp. C33]